MKGIPSFGNINALEQKQIAIHAFSAEISNRMQLEENNIKSDALKRHLKLLSCQKPFIWRFFHDEDVRNEDVQECEYSSILQFHAILDAFIIAILLWPLVASRYRLRRRKKLHKVRQGDADGVAA